MAGTIDAARDANYYLYDNDADNFDSQLNSSSAEYYRNSDDHGVTFGENRWKTGGGIQLGDSDKPGGWGIFGQGKTRDADGTVDRVRDPPRELLPLLYRIKCQASAYNIGLEASFVEAGGSTYGTIPATKFGSCLVVCFPRLGLTERNISDLVEAYGIGNREPAHNAKSRVVPYECCAWKDLCEDVAKAVDIHANGLPAGVKASDVYPSGIKYIGG